MMLSLVSSSFHFWFIRKSRKNASSLEQGGTANSGMSFWHFGQFQNYGMSRNFRHGLGSFRRFLGNSGGLSGSVALCKRFYWKFPSLPALEAGPPPLPGAPSPPPPSRPKYSSSALLAPTPAA